MLICINLPPRERLKPENVYVLGMIPGLKEPTALQLTSILLPLIKELKELRKDYLFSPTSTGPSGSFIHVAILTPIVEVVAMHKLTGFISHSRNHFVIFALFKKLELHTIIPKS
ncbi:hypothetical protein O181_080634 [Austropuccinia psidii MF-1]|uniref:Uncharacterized protein n=1 Tax=Austropuccinia psidii MF-1 TaxID=1389203 RepID=A0A9Q3FLA6_9BASI|nr:hypothetical protein [Austropuccinia psidii MF-1]